jgi:hypothetical protein
VALEHLVSILHYSLYFFKKYVIFYRVISVTDNVNMKVTKVQRYCVVVKTRPSGKLDDEYQR